MARTTTACIVTCLWLLTQSTFGCVYKYGEDPEHPFSKPDDLHFTYKFAGIDWQGMCAVGQAQSPVNIPGSTLMKQVLADTHTIADFGSIRSNGSNIKVINNKHVLQVEWDTDALQSNTTVAIPAGPNSILLDTLGSSNKTRRMRVRPLQFHFHGHSEHSIGGAFYPLEMHIVSHVTESDLPACTGKLGCLTVVGVMFRVADDDADNPLIKNIFDIIPPGFDTPSYMKAGDTLDLNALLPTNRSYVTYSGSLTTPPCSESVLWHVMLEPLAMSNRQLEQFLSAVADQECDDSAKSASNITAGVGNTSSNTPRCQRLGAGQNYRVLQSIADRTIYSYIDGQSSTSKSGSSPPGAPSGVMIAARPDSVAVAVAVLLNFLLMGLLLN